MITKKAFQTVGLLLRVLVEDTPGVNRAIVHTDQGWPVVTWPAHSFLRSAKTSFATPGLLRRTEEFDRKIEIRNHNCVVIELPGRTLLVIPIHEMCLTIDASKNVNLRTARAAIAHVIDDIARSLSTTDHT